MGIEPSNMGFDCPTNHSLPRTFSGMPGLAMKFPECRCIYGEHHKKNMAKWPVETPGKVGGLLRSEIGGWTLSWNPWELIRSFLFPGVFFGTWTVGMVSPCWSIDVFFAHVMGLKSVKSETWCGWKRLGHLRGQTSFLLSIRPSCSCLHLFIQARCPKLGRREHLLSTVYTFYTFLCIL